MTSRLRRLRYNVVLKTWSYECVETPELISASLPTHLNIAREQSPGKKLDHTLLKNFSERDFTSQQSSSQKFRSSGSVKRTTKTTLHRYRKGCSSRFKRPFIQTANSNTNT